MTFEMIIHGKGGHGSRPDKSHNPIECFPPIYAAMQQLPGGCHITKVIGGNSTNIIPNDLLISGSCADGDAEQLKNICNSLCSANHCTVEFHLKGE